METEATEGEPPPQFILDSDVLEDEDLRATLTALEDSIGGAHAATYGSLLHARWVQVLFACVGVKPWGVPWTPALERLWLVWETIVTLWIFATVVIYDSSLPVQFLTKGDDYCAAYFEVAAQRESCTSWTVLQGLMTALLFLSFIVTRLCVVSARRHHSMAFVFSVPYAGSPRRLVTSVAPLVGFGLACVVAVTMTQDGENLFYGLGNGMGFLQWMAVGFQLQLFSQAYKARFGAYLRRMRHGMGREAILSGWVELGALLEELSKAWEHAIGFSSLALFALVGLYYVEYLTSNAIHIVRSGNAEGEVLWNLFLVFMLVQVSVCLRCAMRINNLDAPTVGLYIILHKLLPPNDEYYLLKDLRRLPAEFTVYGIAITRQTTYIALGSTLPIIYDKLSG